MCELSEKTALEESRRSAARLMKRLMLHFRTLMDEELQPLGVTKAQVQLLWAIRNAPGSSGAHLSRLCDVTPQTMQVLIQKTEESGWIVRGKDSVNDRIVTASLTAAGEELLLMAERVIRSIEARLWSGVSSESIATLRGVLEQCLANVTGK
jgi:DNA-binding MarR family transcriptional regulator